MVFERGGPFHPPDILDPSPYPRFSGEPILPAKVVLPMEYLPVAKVPGETVGRTN
jgi:hypothetical protein